MLSQEERFLSYEQNEDYSISDQGRVYNEKQQKFLKITYVRGVYAKVNLRIDNRPTTKLVGKLVAELFVDPPRDSHGNLRPYMDTVIHKNWDTTDCRASNLAWRTRPYASSYYRQRTDRLYYEPQRSVFERRTNLTFEDALEASKHFGVLLLDVVRSCHLDENLINYGLKFQFEDKFMNDNGKGYRG